MNHAEKKVIVIILLVAISIAGFVYWSGENFLQTLIEKNITKQDQAKDNQPPKEKMPLNATVTVNFKPLTNNKADILFDFSHQTTLLGFSLDLVVTSTVQISDITCIKQFSCHSVKASTGRYRISFLALPNVKTPVLDVGILNIATITYKTVTGEGSFYIDEIKSEIRSSFSEQNLLRVKKKKFTLP